MASHGDEKAALADSKRKKYMVVQGILCVLCTLVGAFYPTLLDWSKTAMERGTTVESGSLSTQEYRTYPFSPVSVVLVNDALQLSIAICVVAKKEGLLALWADRGVVAKMMPLGAIYAVGELMTLRSVQKGSGPVYVVIANMKLVIAALMSRAFFGRAWSMPWLHWMELVLISLAAAAFTIAEAGSSGALWRWEGAWMALGKGSLVAFSSVFCEHTYKSNKFLVVLTLQAFWGLVTIVAVIGLSFGGVAFRSLSRELRDDDGARALFGGGPQLELCSSEAHAECLRQLSQVTTAVASESICRCISHRGWDTYTLLTVLADLSNAISSALVFKRLSAVAKYVCRATSAVPMYIFYCLVGRSIWDTRLFGIVLFLCLQVSIYTVQRHRANGVAEAKEAGSWAAQYEGANGAAAAGNGEGLRQRAVPAAP